jgi:hypothetical protein
VKFTTHLLINPFLNFPAMSSFENFDLNFSLESAQSSLEREFLVAEEHCKMIKRKCEASKVKATEVKARFDKLQGNAKREFLAESLTPVMNSHMANVEELKEVRKARNSLKIAIVSFFDVDIGEFDKLSFRDWQVKQ